MLIFWGERVNICQMIKSDFSIEVKVEGEGSEGKIWVVFIYASTEDHIRRGQWEKLKARRSSWGERWILREDFNDVSHEDKQMGRMRGESSFSPFRTFIREM